jgi:hypothetical protein
LLAGRKATSAADAAWCVHAKGVVTRLERRKGFGTAAIDRRKSYVDVVERVLGNSFPAAAPIGARRFVTHLNTSQWRVGSTVAEIYVFVLHQPGHRRTH